MPELSEELNKLVLECNVKSKINKVTNQIKRLHRVNSSDEDLSRRETKLLQRIDKKGSVMKKLLHNNQKMLVRLLNLEHSLLKREKKQATQLLRQHQASFTRHCRCLDKNSKASNMAKHYLHHKADKRSKWPVFSLKEAEKAY